MVALLAALTVLLGQDTTATSVSPRAMALLDRFPPPVPGSVSVATRFSQDTAWIGEQVELVTVAWFPRALRERLRDRPTLRAPALTGLWSLRSDVVPVLAESRWVGSYYYDVFVSDQTIFPLGAGPIVAPPAVLTYAVPTSTSYYAPQERRTLSSQSVTLEVRAVPASMTGALGAGPTGRSLGATWRGPAGALVPGAPAIVDLVISGEGNLALWPAPDIAWPGGLRVYAEPTQVRVSSSSGWIGGEKHFRFTVVAESAGVVTLPAVSYPYFDPRAAHVAVARAAALSLPVVPAPPGIATRQPLPVSAGAGVPWTTVFVQSGWPALVLLVVAAPVLVLLLRRKRPATSPATPPAEAEGELRLLLATPADAGPERVVAALRHRGINRQDAEQIRRWLSASLARRYGRNHPVGPPPPPALQRALARLRRPAALILLILLTRPLSGQSSSGVSRYRGGDYAGAARAFATLVEHDRDAADAWRDLGSSRWMAGDDVGATAAWLRAMLLAPRDPLTELAWRQADAIPADVRALAPSVPLSRDELVLLAVALWVSMWLLIGFRRRRLALACAMVLLLVAAGGAARWRQLAYREALVRAGATLRVSPTEAAPSLGDVAEWSRVTVTGARGGWYLIATPDGKEGWVARNLIAGIGPLD